MNKQQIIQESTKKLIDDNDTQFLNVLYKLTNNEIAIVKTRLADARVKAIDLVYKLKPELSK